jgi:hypothetical protein
MREAAPPSPAAPPPPSEAQSWLSSAGAAAHLFEKRHALLLEATVQPPASARVHKINQLLRRQIQQVVEVNATVGELAEGALLLKLHGRSLIDFVVSLQGTQRDGGPSASRAATAWRAVRQHEGHGASQLSPSWRASTTWTYEPLQNPTCPTKIVGDDIINTSAQAARIVGSTTTIIVSKTTTPLVPGSFRKFLTDSERPCPRRWSSRPCLHMRPVRSCRFRSLRMRRIHSCRFSDSLSI